MKIGDKLPNFTLKDKNGDSHSLKDIKAKYTVVYFYPKDNTPGCTIETKGFDKNLKYFKKLNTKIIGISGGDEKSKNKFCKSHDLKILLLSDSDFKISSRYGIYGEKSFMGRKYLGISRITFILDKDKRIIKKYEKVNPLNHPNEVIEFLKSL